MNVDRRTLAAGIDIQHVTRRFGSVVAVADVSLTLRPGAFFSLVGPSGCGKTTLLRILAGLIPPDAGRIVADGRDITSLPPEHRPCNMVFQRYALFPHLTVEENLAFGLTTDRRTRPPRAEIRRRVHAMLDLVRLQGLEHRYPADLSGGQQQRVAVARALIRRPQALLLDEPMSALDRNVRHQIREELLQIHAELGTTFVLVTHDQDEALSISTEVALMNAGRLEQVGTPGDLYHRPATLFAAHFIGAGAFVDASARCGAGGGLDVSVGDITFTASTVGPVPDGPVRVLLRPADLRITDPGTGRVDGRVESCAFFGAYHELRVATRIGALRLVQPAAAAVGSIVGVAWPDRAGIAYAAGPAQS
jgi:ABC-type Fe3+/spermidine/putrescine transport system ATPase subunit